VPLILIVGKALAEGEVEVKDRKSGARDRIAVADAVPTLLSSLSRDSLESGAI